MDIPVVVIGAGHAGLAMSRRLTERSLDHVVLERGEVANSWRTERWDSLRLLTPNWQNALPGQAGDGGDPDGFLTAVEVAALVRRYADTVAAPVLTSTTVTELRAAADRYEVVTTGGTWRADAVVIASGPANVARVPDVVHQLPPGLPVFDALSYRNPADLPEAGVLVLGASATGVQLAEEIQRSGRSVTLSVGQHVRMPRRYRGRDIFWWLDRTGILDERHDRIDHLVRARHVPSPQLVGGTDRRSVDLAALRSLGVTIVGRVGRVVDGVAQCSGSLANTCALADLKMNRLLDRCDDAARVGALDVGPPDRPEPTEPGPAPLAVDLHRAGIGSVVLAAGFRPDYSWLRLPVLDRHGRIAHDGGEITAAPGTFVLGQSILRRRRSTYISGAAADTAELAVELHRHLDATRPRTRVRA